MSTELKENNTNDKKINPFIGLKRKKKRRRRRKKLKIFETFTKLWVSILLIIAVIDLQLSYILAYIGRDEIAETLSVAIVTEIIGIIGVYMVRAFFDTASEKKLDFDYKKHGLHPTDNTPVGIEDDDDNVEEESDTEGVG